MKAHFKKSHALMSCMVVSSLMASGCSSPDAGPTTGKVSLTLTRNGKPAAGMQTILQKESDNSEIGSGLSDSTGKIATSVFSGTAMATFIDAASASQSYLFTLHNIKAGASITVNLPLLAPAVLGTVMINTPSGLSGADRYNFYVLTGSDATTHTEFAPLVPGTPITMNVNEDAPLPNGKVTLVAVAFQSVAGQEKPIAYSVLKDVTYAPTGVIPTAQNFTSWQTDLNDVSVRIAAIPNGFNADGASASIRQFVKGTLLSADPFSIPTVFSTAPLDFDMRIIPGLADEYETVTTLTDTAGKSLYAQVRKTANLPSLTSWNPSASGLPQSSAIQLDPLSPAGSPRLKWTQSSSAIGVADVALIALGWSSGAKSFGWYALTNPENVDKGSYQFPTLPPAYAGFSPPAGTLFTTGVVLYGDYSTLQDYDTFLNSENLNLLLFKLATGQNIELNLAGASGAP